MKSSERGTSIIEVVVILLIIGILTTITTMSILAPKKYKAEAQALLLIEVMREAQQQALSEKKTLRVQIEPDNRQIRLINENEPQYNPDNSVQPATVANDVIEKTVPYNSDHVYVATTPANMSAAPVEATPVLPISVSNSVAVLRFKPNGTVHNVGNNNLGEGSTATGATIYVWSKKEFDPSTAPTVADVLRAVTVIGSSGSARLWKCDVGDGQCDNWTR